MTASGYRPTSRDVPCSESETKCEKSKLQICNSTLSKFVRFSFLLVLRSRDGFYLLARFRSERGLGVRLRVHQESRASSRDPA
jgi:hypothetical protein